MSVDRDGTMDLIITSCPTSSSSNDDCKLSIAYNIQVPLCTSTSVKDLVRTGPCRDPENLCLADDEFKFNFSEDQENDVCSFSSFSFFPLSYLSAIPFFFLFPFFIKSLLTINTKYRHLHQSQSQLSSPLQRS